MRELNTIQKREKLNTIYATDEKGNGGAHHEYHIVVEAEEDAAYDVRIIKFQEGPRKDINSTQGIIDSDLLEIVRDRLKDFQAGPLVVEPEEKNSFTAYITKNQYESEINRLISELEDKSNISDGSHTFGELYHHRAILFAVICNTYKENSWKSWKHEDNTMYEDYFIVGVTTAEGNYTYHYHKDYWDIFKVKELPNAPAYDGHKPEDIDRLFTLIK